MLVVSVLFLSFSGATTAASYMQLESMFDLSLLRGEMFPDTKLAIQTEKLRFGYFFIAIQVIGILVALNFMWDIRHPKSE